MYNDRGYLIDNGKRVHREIMRPILLDALEELFPDEDWVTHHIDRNKTNNDIFNLQIMTNEEHSYLHSQEDIKWLRDSRKLSKFPGATLQRQKNPERKCWKCEIKWRNKSRYIALFEDPLSAHIVYKLIEPELNMEMIKS